MEVIEVIQTLIQLKAGHCKGTLCQCPTLMVNCNPALCAISSCLIMPVHYQSQPPCHSNPLQYRIDQQETHSTGRGGCAAPRDSLSEPLACHQGRHLGWRLSPASVGSRHGRCQYYRAEQWRSTYVKTICLWFAITPYLS